jgi:hypothetical protein
MRVFPGVGMATARGGPIAMARTTSITRSDGDIGTHQTGLIYQADLMYGGWVAPPGRASTPPLEMLGPATRLEPVRKTLIAQREGERSPEASAIPAGVWAASFAIDLRRQLDPALDADAAIDVLARLVLR